MTGFGYTEFTKSIFQGSIIIRSHINTRGQSINTDALARMYFAIAKIPHRFWERAVSIQGFCNFFHSTFYHYIITNFHPTNSFFFLFLITELNVSVCIIKCSNSSRCRSLLQSRFYNFPGLLSHNFFFSLLSEKKYK